MSEQLNKEVYISEAYLTALFWSDPDLYSMFPEDKLNKNSFGNAIWSFYFQLGRHIHSKKIPVFDDISVLNAVKEYNVESYFDKYGGFDTINQLIKEVKDNQDNLEGYYDEVKKYGILREFNKLFGNQVIEKKGKYDYVLMSREQLQTYWMDKVNQIIINNDSPVEEHNLLEGLRELIDEIDVNPDIGMEFHNSKLFTEITNGWAFGTITLLSGFSGNGKTSFAVEKVIMSAIKSKEKLLIIANEMSVKDFKKLLIITVMGSKELYEKFEKDKQFDRKNINKGNFSSEEKKRLHETVDWIESNIGDNTNLIKFVPLEEYTIDNVEKVIRHYAHRNYRRIILDTAKPTEGGNEQRWQRFVQDFERLYKLTRDGGGGLNLALFATVQAADEALKSRFLDERCLADARKIKNVVDSTFHMRPVWQDELKEGKKQLTVYRFFPNDIDEESLKKNGWSMDFESLLEDKSYKKWTKELEVGDNYYLVFTSKNRRGQSNLTGLDVLVYRVDFNTNRWMEIGWTRVDRDYSY